MYNNSYYTPVKPYIKEIYRLINLISDCHTVVRRYLDITQEKIAIKIKATFNQCIICVNNTIEKFYHIYSNCGPGVLLFFYPKTRIKPSK